MEVVGGKCEALCETLFPPTVGVGSYDPLKCREDKLAALALCTAGGFDGANVCGISCPANAGCGAECDVYCHFAHVECPNLYATEVDCRRICEMQDILTTNVACHVGRLIQIASGQAVSCDSAAIAAACQ
jgi:hypothetical protein